MNPVILTTMPTETNMLAIASRGGFLMIVLLIISIIAIAIIIERLLLLKKTKKSEEELLQDIYGKLADNKAEQAIQTCEQQDNTPFARVLTRALDMMGSRYEELKEIVEFSVKKEVHKFQKNLGTLATFAAIAPLVGFLGTVTGMVKVFMRISETGGGVDITLLASGIWEALLTTVGGLTVGIICILFYNYLVGRVEEIAQDLEENSSEFLINIQRINRKNSIR